MADSTNRIDTERNFVSQNKTNSNNLSRSRFANDYLLDHIDDPNFEYNST